MIPIILIKQREGYVKSISKKEEIKIYQYEIALLFLTAKQISILQK